MGVYFYGCITLDGYLADRNHGLDWLHQSGTVEETGYEDFYRRMDVTVMGRRTFQETARLGRLKEIYPATDNYVFTHRGYAPQEGVHFVSGDVVRFVRELGEKKRIWIVGGNTILAPLLEADMVDFLTVQVAPVLLGDGIPLFTQAEAPRRFHLREVRQYGQFAELVYQKAEV